MTKEDLFGGFFVIIFFGLFIWLMIWSMWSLRISQVGEGVHTGYITAVDQRGWFFQNYDVYFKTDNQSSQEDVYCISIKDKELAKKAQEISQSRKLVSIKYKGVRGWGCGLCQDTQILNIEEHNK